MIENEFKIMLNREQYEKLLAVYEWDEVISQTNHYYDDKESLFLSEQGITCRIREIDGKFVLQMKFPPAENAAEYSRMEQEIPLDHLPDVIGLHDVPDEAYLSQPHDVRGVSCLGSLKTTRNVHRFEGGEIDLDKSEYFGKIDYEIEIEFTDENNARKVLDEIKEKLDIEPNSLVCTGKIHRFINEYKNIEKAP